MIVVCYTENFPGNQEFYLFARWPWVNTWLDYVPLPSEIRRCKLNLSAVL